MPNNSEMEKDKQEQLKWYMKRPPPTQAELLEAFSSYSSMFLSLVCCINEN